MVERISEAAGSAVLVTGGAGYVGSHACKALARAGFRPVAFDSLETGWRQAVRWGPFEHGDLRDPAALAAAFARHRPVAVMHFAALSDIGRSVRDPATCWAVNLGGTLNLLQAMAAAGVRRLVFSSSCAIYGAQDGVLLDEGSAQRPINPYGASKRAAEDMIHGFAAGTGAGAGETGAGAGAGIDCVTLRYFNVAGADPEGELGECHRPETHLIPSAIEAVQGLRPRLVVHGGDFPTPDGTCIRDYVHVGDVAAAHLLALEHLLAGRGSDGFNLGSGRGHSVREVLDAVAAATGQAVPMALGPRRPGDCARLVSGSRRAAEVLGWRPAIPGIEAIIASAWDWHRKPGYTA